MITVFRSLSRTRSGQRSPRGPNQAHNRLDSPLQACNPQEASYPQPDHIRMAAHTPAALLAERTSVNWAPDHKALMGSPTRYG